MSITAAESIPPMRIGILSAHEGAAYWTSLVDEINARGSINLASLHSFDDSHYRSPKSLFGRIAIKLRIYVWYPLYVTMMLLFKSARFEAFLVVTSPFFLPALAALLSRRPVITLCNDVYPEALVLARLVRRGSLLEKVLRSISVFGLRKAAAVVFISEKHRQYFSSLPLEQSRLHIIPVGSDGSLFPALEPLDLVNEVRVLYCGTLGHMHDTRTLIEFLRKHELPRPCRLIFHTSGAAKLNLERQIAELGVQQVTTGDALPLGDWVRAMSSSAVGLVLQQEGAENVIFPSKAFSILMAGQAILAIANPDSDLARLISKFDCGWAVATRDVEGLRVAFSEIAQPEILQRKRENAFAAGHREFDVSHLAQRWHEVLIDALIPKRIDSPTPL